MAHSLMEEEPLLHISHDVFSLVSMGGRWMSVTCTHAEMWHTVCASVCDVHESVVCV